MIIVLILLLSANLTTYSQTTSIKEDSICLSKEDARIIFKDLQLGELCDSIRTNQQSQIKRYKEVIINNDQQLLLYTNRLEIKEKELNKAYLKLKISKRITFLGVPTAIGLGFLLGLTLN